MENELKTKMAEFLDGVQRAAIEWDDSDFTPLYILVGYTGTEQVYGPVPMVGFTPTTKIYGPVFTVEELEEIQGIITTLNKWL